VLVVSDNVGPHDRRIGRVYRLDGQKPVLMTELPVLFGPNVFVTPDDQRVVFSTETTVGVWDARTGGKKYWQLPGP